MLQQRSGPILYQTEDAHETTLTRRQIKLNHFFDSKIRVLHQPDPLLNELRFFAHRK